MAGCINAAHVRSTKWIGIMISIRLSAALHPLRWRGGGHERWLRVLGGEIHATTISAPPTSKTDNPLTSHFVLLAGLDDLDICTVALFSKCPL